MQKLFLFSKFFFIIMISIFFISCSNGSSGLKDANSYEVTTDSSGSKGEGETTDSSGSKGEGETTNPSGSNGGGETTNPSGSNGEGETTNPSGSKGGGETTNSSGSNVGGETINPSDSKGEGETTNPSGSNGGGETTKNVGFEKYFFLLGANKEKIEGKIDKKNKTVKFILPNMISLVNLVSDFELFDVTKEVFVSSNIPQIRGITQNDFTNKVTYYFGDNVTYDVGVQLEATIKSFNIDHAIGIINDDNKTISIKIRKSKRNLIATFDLFDGVIATVKGMQQHSGVTQNDFTKPVIYEFIFHGVSVKYTVIVNPAG